MFSNLNFSNNNRFVQNPGNIVSDMDGEKVMLSVDKGKYFNLGEIGGEIWDLMKAPISLQELVENLHSQYEVDPNVCREKVVVFLSQLLNEGLIQVEEKVES